VFVSRPTFAAGNLDLRIQVLRLVNKHCSERVGTVIKYWSTTNLILQPLAIRLLELNDIWSLLSKFLSKSPTHDLETSATTFSHIIGIMNTLISLRRDLVLHTLPHLCMVLRQLIFALRCPLPELGGRQSRLITDTLPIWINAQMMPLGMTEAKALSRLLSAITTKSISRGLAGETQKAESLSKPFSKYAAHVLKAYIEAMNDPLCVLPLELRKELAPGIFALCDMINEHARDALMASTSDAGGKGTLKLLWKEYEKQRYVGKG
jgi:hypothetical protein